MATLLLSAAGAAIGGSFGGTFAGLASGAIGKAVGATLGAVIDQKLTGLGSEPVETGRVERFRVMGASEGAPLPRIFGRIRAAGQVVWSSRFLENVDSTRVGGKGAGRRSQEVREYSYSISLAIAICEGEVTRIGRIWADGQQLDMSGIVWRLHTGSEDQLPDPAIAAIEGSDDAPAYRGTAYVVFENLDLTPYGNRIPQFNFEVFRQPSAVLPGVPRAPAQDVRGVALVPGTGEYALATTPVHFVHGKGRSNVANVNNDRGLPDLVVSLEQMRAELPAAKSVSLVVSWFGNDLRCAQCLLRPAVEQDQHDGKQMPWRVSGVNRNVAHVVSRVDGRPLFGGTPADESVIEAIRHIRRSDQSVMFYPFILMDIPGNNGLQDPWTGDDHQPAVPWRGRITLSVAPGRLGSPDKTSAAAEQVRRFFGNAQASDFRIDDGKVVYNGPAEWSYRRFILHYAYLCKLSGGVDAFCIGSEMRSLTHVRDGADTYPTVRELCELAEAVREVLGPESKIGYAADWSEYFGHQPNDGSGDVIFHLDPLWSHAEIDFVGIDNYMPLSDWRDGSGHADAHMGSIYNVEYLKNNVAGGEGFDWYYRDLDDRNRQERSPIFDSSFGEDWVFRYKDISGWWANPHFNRVNGVRSHSQTTWRPQSKPVWFTELGCPAVDKGTNQPNVFYDPKSSESYFPYWSTGIQDEFIQYRYIQAVFSFWNDSQNNPHSDVYGGPMLDLDHAYVWAWDTRPWPDFPYRLETWIDGLNFERGHWVNARIGRPALDAVVAEICVDAAMAEVDVAALHGGLTGYMIDRVETARQSLQPLMLTFAFDSFSSDGRIAFANRDGRISHQLSLETLAVPADVATVSATRSAKVESPGRVMLGYLHADLDYQSAAAEAVSPEAAEPDATHSSVPIVLSENEARAVADRWLSESRVARDSIQASLPMSRLAVTAGDVVSILVGDRMESFRVDRLEDLGSRSITAVRVEASIYAAPVYVAPVARSKAIAVASPVYAEFLDLPLLTGDEKPHAPHVAVAKVPWAGPVSVFAASGDFGYALNRDILRSATLGETVEPLFAGAPGRWMRGTMRVRLSSGTLQSAGVGDVLNGANVAAVRFGGTGEWEIIQFSNAVLTGANEYLLSGILRGQAGTDAFVPSILPPGADFVLLDTAVKQIDLMLSTRGLARHYRIGPSSRPYSDSSYLHVVKAFPGAGLRPYRPAHVRAARNENGDIAISWIRRTRIDGDSWEAGDAPLGEEMELYDILIRQNGKEIRRFQANSNRKIYLQTEQEEDLISGDFEISVAQISVQYGAGPHQHLLFRM